MQISLKARVALALATSVTVVGLLGSTGGGSAALAQHNVSAHSFGPIVQPIATRQAPAQSATFKSPFGWQLSTHVATFKTLYRFKGGTDGENPYAGLIDVGDTLYGTTFGGGSGGGTVFKITLSGSYKVLHLFHGSDGLSPHSSLINVRDTLYGTTAYGGTSGNGTVFKITPSGAESVLHSFRDDTNGATPYSRLVDVGGTLYGTTQHGSQGCCGGMGTVFKITPSGAHTVLYKFKGSLLSPPDGAYPSAGLIDVGGTLYSTTAGGGTSNAGTVFKITQSGAERVLYRGFGNAPNDGAYPNGDLINVGGTLYGTTDFGGSNNDGTVFRITPSGAYSVVHSFNGSDGKNPTSGLIDVGGMLYGTTRYGGATGNGTVFKITLSGAESVLHSFNGSDGAQPICNLINVGSTLYGTTSQGGTNNAGTVFSILL